MRLPGLGPKTARRIWQELGITTVDALRAAAEAQQLRGLAGLGREVGGEDPGRAREARSGRGAAARAARDGAAEAARRRGGRWPRIRPRSQVSIAGSARRFRETVRDLDLIATATDARALIDAFCSLPWVVEVAAKGADEGDGRRARTACASTCASSRPRPTATCSSTSPARRRTTSRCARRPCGAGSRSPSTGSPRSRPASVHAFATEEEVYAFLGYEWIPPELRENGGELEAARTGALPTLVELGRPARRPPHAHDLVGRQATRSRRWSAGRSRRVTTTTRSATTPTGCATAGSSEQAEAIDALNAAPADQAPQGDRGEHPRRRRARRRRRGPRRARLGRRVGAPRVRQGPDRARARGDGEPVRRLHRPRHEPQDRQARSVGHRRRARDREGARDRHVPRDQLAARPARPDRRPRPRGARGRPEARDRLRRPPALGARLRRARRRPGAACVADAGTTSSTRARWKQVERLRKRAR